MPTLLWADLTNPYVWIAVLATAAFGAIGFADDYLKIVAPLASRPAAALQDGLAGRWSALGVGVALLLRSTQHDALQHAADLPVLQAADSRSRLVYVPFAVFVLVGCDATPST